MKIIKVAYKDGEARFVLKGFPDKTICVILNTGMTLSDVKNTLKSMIPEDKEIIYNDLNIKDLEGTEI